ncbi:MAG: hypothetical protein BWX80_04075 [Candidatus Hydrogenedentes bacterium ADurb.Bin101]|nr:MAG: hypothetical protein BWX80_04075 [Candidatus Hydrogenedentes bacterium ADurb.Bin101]
MSERTLPTVEELRANGCCGYTFDELVELDSEVLGFPVSHPTEDIRDGSALLMASSLLAGMIPPKSAGLSDLNASK